MTLKLASMTREKCWVLLLQQEVPKGQEEVGGKKEGGGDLCARARRAHPRDGRLLFKNWFHN